MWNRDIVIYVFKNIDLRFKKIYSFLIFIMRNISGTENFYKQKRCGSTISISLYFYFSFIEQIILNSENRLLDNTFARSPERGEFSDPAFSISTITAREILKKILQLLRVIFFVAIHNILERKKNMRFSASSICRGTPHI